MDSLSEATFSGTRVEKTLQESAQHKQVGRKQMRLNFPSLYSWIADVLYWIHINPQLAVSERVGLGKVLMTYLDVVYRYASAPSERVMRAMDAVREVYGIRRILFNDKEQTVRVEFDASRLSEDAVAKLLKQAGLDIREKLALA